MTVETLEQLFVRDLGAMYDAEKQILLALPKMAAAATDADLKEAFEAHLEETKGQIQRIEQAAAAAKLKLEPVLCTVVQAMIRDSETDMKTVAPGALLDVALVGGAQKVEHHEIAAYLSLINMATELGFVDAADLLEVTLDEEAATDEKLGSICHEGLLEEAGSSQAEAA